MTLLIYEQDTIEELGDAVRSVTGTENPMTVDEMTEALEELVENGPMTGDLSALEERITALEQNIGGIEEVLDEIIALQDYYTGATFDELHEYAKEVKQGGTQ